MVVTSLHKRGARGDDGDDVFQSRVQSGRDAGEEGGAGGAGVRHRPGPAGACAADYRGIPALDGESAGLLVELLAMPEAADIEFEEFDPLRWSGQSLQPADWLMYLLDTNVVSELRRATAGKADPRVVAWAASVSVASLFLSVVTVLEPEWGVLRIERRDPVQGALLRAWLEERVLPAFSERMLPVDIAVARRCARLHVPDLRSERDVDCGDGVDAWLDRRDTERSGFPADRGGDVRSWWTFEVPSA